MSTKPAAAQQSELSCWQNGKPHLGTPYLQPLYEILFLIPLISSHLGLTEQNCLN